MPQFRRHEGELTAELHEQQRQERAERRRVANARIETGLSPLTMNDDQRAQFRRRRHLEGLASGFHYSPEMEQAIRWREKEDPRYDRLAPATKMRVGHYLEAKAAAKELGRDVSGGQAR